MARPKGSTTKHLTEAERQRIRTLYNDANLPQAQIVSITGFSKDQVRVAIRAPSAAVAPRSGRPRIKKPRQEAS
ncbi:hypothetical protein CORC01_03966 [Colletotrichum orchidophilum]|uniref:Uncharacterized protein n=1 Tax=Colletotrichum orchidophilum TaxID=1209926 RepID=A0A1G4BGY1_9PEZI|nr:uncharacterized protein CORC01_03966 [Colletotrichum orchidophilum]OHF00649.1 hypothetical protein CORC01_03966 [Colletotrichum orchidophilum]